MIQNQEYLMDTVNIVHYTVLIRKPTKIKIGNIGNSDSNFQIFPKFLFQISIISPNGFMFVQ